ncbi:MAG: hypothetical protein SGI77_20225 [Pirellulaceae bacterium]|nr:hypothetical protein [Pirellulaceae bacterium]
MNEQSMRHFLNVMPFEPFVVVLSSGQRYEVRHPENVLLSKTKIVIMNPDADTVAVCGLLHVATVETQQTA